MVRLCFLNMELILLNAVLAFCYNICKYIIYPLSIKLNSFIIYFTRGFPTNAFSVSVKISGDSIQPCLISRKISFSYVFSSFNFTIILKYLSFQYFSRFPFIIAFDWLIYWFNSLVLVIYFICGLFSAWFTMLWFDFVDLLGCLCRLSLAKSISEAKLYLWYCHCNHCTFCSCL